MNTKPIINYLDELDFTNHPSPEYGDDVPDILPDEDELETDVEQQTELLSFMEHLLEMKKKFEDSIFEAIPEPNFKQQLLIIVDRLQAIVCRYNDYKEDELLSHTLGKKQELLNQMAVDSLNYLKHIINESNNTEIEPCSKPCKVTNPNDEPDDGIIEGEIISGVRSLAKFLGCGTNKAQAIISSKILEKEGIQWNAGRWKFNKTKLTQFIKDNPDAFTKIRCTR